MKILAFRRPAHVKRWEWLVLAGTHILVVVLGIWFQCVLATWDPLKLDDVFVPAMCVPAIAVSFAIVLPLSAQPANVACLMALTYFVAPHAGDIGLTYMSASVLCGFSVLAAIVVTVIAAIRVFFRIQRERGNQR